MKIEDLIKQNYEYMYRGHKEPFTLLEVIKEKWVYAKSKDGDEIIPVSVILRDWNEQEAKRLEIEQAESGKPAVVEYFKKYGVLGKRTTTQGPYDLCSFSSTIVYDGRYKFGPNHRNNVWNTEIDKYHLMIYDDHNINNIIGRPEYVNQLAMGVSKTTDDLIDGSFVDGVPVLTQCHRRDEKLHLVMTNHVKHEDWIADLHHALDIFVKKIDAMLSDDLIKVASKHNLMRQGSRNELFQYVSDNEKHNNWHHCPRMFFNRFQIAKGKDGEKYRRVEGYHDWKKVPSENKWDKTITKAQLLQDIRDSFLSQINSNGVTAKFKY